MERALDLFVEAGPATGYGHVRRCLSISAHLRADLGVVCRFLMPQDSDAASVRAAGFAVRCVDNLAAIINAPGALPAALVVDTPRISQPALKTLHAAGVALAVFDDGRRLARYPADVVIDSSPAAPDLGYESDTGAQFCLGARYFPLRPEFAAQRQPRHDAKARVDTIAVTFGGSDPDDATATIAAQLAGSPPLATTTFVLGPGYRGRLAAPPWPSSRLVRDADDMAALLTTADLAISAAGGTALELAYLGVPSILIALSDDQVGIAQALDKAGAALALGALQNFSSNRLDTTLRSLLADGNRRADMAQKGRDIVDGKGIERICSVLAQRLLARVTA